MNESEKRRHPRVPVNRPGRIRIANEPESNAQLIDISENGAASLFYSRPVSVGTSIELRVRLMIGAQAQELLVYGEVRHYHSRGESHVIGVQFTHFGPGTAEAIRDFVQYKLTKMED